MCAPYEYAVSCGGSTRPSLDGGFDFTHQQAPDGCVGVGGTPAGNAYSCCPVRVACSTVTIRHHQVPDAIRFGPHDPDPDPDPDLDLDRDRAPRPRTAEGGADVGAAELTATTSLPGASDMR